MKRQIRRSEEARTSIKAGIDEVAETVKVTLGARGRNVVLDTNPYTNPTVTNDGVTIARELVLDEPYRNAGAKLIREVASRTNDNVGDGTTTAIVLMQAIIDQGLKAIAGGADPVYIRKGIEETVDKIIAKIKEEAVKAEDAKSLEWVATISSGDEKIGKLVAEVVNQAGAEGVVTLEDNPLPEIEYEKLEGLRLRGGFQFPIFVNRPESYQSVFEDVPVFVTNQDITAAQEMAKIAEAAAKQNKKEAIVIANSITGEALHSTVVNWANNQFKLLPLRVAAFGETGEGSLRDVAAVTGAAYFSQDEAKNITEVQPDDLGRIKRLVASKEETTIIADDEKLKKKRISELEAELKNDSTRDYNRKSIEERIAKLKSIMFTIKIGSTTDTERKEKKLRVEDAVNAAKAALEDGVVAGGGSALYRAIQGIKVGGVDAFSDGDEGMGGRALCKACEKPLEQMAENVSKKLDGGEIQAIIKDPKKAIDFRSVEVVDAFEKGIIDPAKVVIESLKNAASGAVMFLTTDAVVVDVEEPKEEKI